MENQITLPTTPVDLTQTQQPPQITIPQPNTPTRYDQIKITLIGLLSNQSSLNTPTTHHTGTNHYNLNTNTLQTYDTNNNTPTEISNHTILGTLTLQQLADLIHTKLQINPPTIHLHYKTNTETNTITLPNNLPITQNHQPYAYINGKRTTCTLEYQSCPPKITFENTIPTNTNITILLK